MAFLDKFAESSNFFAGSLGSRDSLLECMLIPVIEMLKCNCSEGWWKAGGGAGGAGGFQDWEEQQLQGAQHAFQL